MHKHNVCIVSKFINWGSIYLKCSLSNVIFRASDKTYRNGTCFTMAECNEKGGSSSGSCAGG